MRSRSRIVVNSVKPATVHTQVSVACTSTLSPYSWTSPLVSGSYPVAAVNIDEEYSSIVDELASGRKAKGVRHIKYRKVLMGERPWVRAGTSAPTQAGYNVGSLPVYQHNEVVSQDTGTKQLLPTPLGVLPGVTVNWAQADDQVVVQSLFDKARKPVIDGLLNLVESPEIPSALKSLTTMGPKMAPKWNMIAAQLKTFRESTNGKRLLKAASARGSAMSKDISNKYLAYSFGVAPIISDIEKVRSYMNVIKADYDKYRDNKVRRVSAVYRGSTSFSLPDSGEYSFSGIPVHNPETRYVLTYTDRNPYSTPFIAKLDFLLRRFGTAGPASFLWERIPFSFVVDWFIDTSSVLDYLDSKLQSERINVISLTKSRKYTYLSSCFRTVKRSDTYEIVHQATQGTVTHSYYERTPLGKSTYVGLSDRFGKKQLSLSVALLRQLSNK